MRQKFLIFISFVILIIVLIGLNAASYIKKDQTPDSEMRPNRSTFNTGATGTRAFYDLLAESGRTVTRWQESPTELLIRGKDKPNTFVVVGTVRREFTDAETESLMRWVSRGGRLVLIDRRPPTELVKTSAHWKISTVLEPEPPLFTDPSDIKQMTDKTAAAKPIQPTVYTSKINAVQASRFASSVTFERLTDGETAVSDTNSNTKPPAEAPAKDKSEHDPPKSNDGGDGGITTKVDAPAPVAPVAHLADQSKTLLADFPYGAGRIVYLSDPFIVSNGGINLVDNAQLGINLVASNGGIIAFDEFHQGYGAGQNRLLDYFAGTPLTSIFLQFAALVAVILFTQSRRFARPLPADEPNRLSKLEYVGAMAELQQRTKAFDLAMENIYKDFRRRTARLVGADALKTPRTDLARLIAERIKANPAEIETLLEKCENIMHGEPTNKREMLDLIGKLRGVEEALGLQRRKKSSRIV